MSETMAVTRPVSWKQRARFIGEVLSDTVDRFADNEGPRLGAAFAYYATFSIFPLLLLSMTVVGFVLGDSTHARQQMLAAIANPDSPVRDVLDKTVSAMQASQSGRGVSAVFGIFALLFAASGAFVELHVALNRVWCVPTQESKGIVGSVRDFVRDRLTGFAIVAGLGLTLLVSLASSAVLGFFTDRAASRIAIPLWPAIVRTSELTASILVMTGAFTLAFHLIPRSRPPVRAVYGGALLTTILLSALKEIFATYLSHLTSYSAYGVAGGVLALASWIYLSSMIIFFGAQLTRIHAEKMGVVEKCAARSDHRAESTS
jgi:membrane protein